MRLFFAVKDMPKSGNGMMNAAIGLALTYSFSK